MQKPSQVEGKYEILGKLGEGGMGAIFKVRHRLLDELRVIKIIQPKLEHDEELKSRFVREAQSVMRLRHPNIAQVHDFSVDEKGRAFMVMEYVEGVTLADALEAQDVISVGIAVEVARQTLSALGHLHRRGIVHRDISPDNLMVCRGEDGGVSIKLIDLGIAKILLDPNFQTQAGTFVGKARYCSPEQVNAGASGQIDGRSDLYSLGVVLYELVTGKSPFSAHDIKPLIEQQINMPPLPFDQTDPNRRAPYKLRSIILKALAKHPKDRFQSAEAMSKALHGLKKKYPVETEEMEHILKAPVTGRRIVTTRLVSMQRQLDRQFRLGPEVVGRQRSEASTSSDRLRRSTVGEGEGKQEEVPFEGAPDQGTTQKVKAEPTSSTMTPELRKELLGSLLVGAEKLIQAGFCEEAVRQLNVVLQLDGRNSEARALLAGLSDQTPAAEMAPKPMVSIDDDPLPMPLLLDVTMPPVGEGLSGDPLDPTIADPSVSQGEEPVMRPELVAMSVDSHELHEAVQSIWVALSHGDFAEAAARVAEAREEIGDRPEIIALSQHVQEQLERKRQAEILSAMRRSRELVAEGNAEAAIDLLEASLSLYPTDGGLLLALRAAHDAYKSEQRKNDERRKALASRLEIINSLLQTGNLETAAAVLTKAVDELGDCDELKTARAQYETARGERIAREVRFKLRDAAKFVERNQYAEAIVCLQQVLALAPDDGTIQEILEKTRRTQEEYFAQQRKIALLRDAVQEIESCIERGALDAAEEKLGHAVCQIGESPELSALTKRIIDLRHLQREARIKGLLRKATESIEAFDFSHGIRFVEEALRIEPGNEEVAAILEKAKEAERDYHHDQEKQRLIAESLAGVDELIARGSLERAEQRLVALVLRVGHAPEVTAIRQRLDEAVALRNQTTEKLETALSKGRDLVAMQQFEQALVLLHEASLLAPEDPEVQTLLSEAERGSTEQAMVRRRAQEISHAAAMIEHEIKAGAYNEARRQLALAERLYGSESIFRSLNRRLECLVKQQREAEVGGLIEQARNCAIEGSFELAISVLHQARDLDPTNSEIAQLLDEFPRRQAVMTIERFLNRGQLREAQRAFAFAEKLYGTGDPFIEPLRNHFRDFNVN